MEVTDSPLRAQQVALLPSMTPPHTAPHHSTGMCVAAPWRIPKALPLLLIGAPRQRNMAQMKKIKTPKIKLSKEEGAKLADAEFKTLVIRMLTEIVEYGHKIEEKVKAMKSEIKENVQGTNSEGKEIRTQMNDLEQKEEINT